MTAASSLRTREAATSCCTLQQGPRPASGIQAGMRSPSGLRRCQEAGSLSQTREPSNPVVDLDELWKNARSELAAVTDVASLDAWRLSYLGRRGALTLVLRGLGELAPEERRSVGARANELRAELEKSLEERQAALER